MTPLFGPSLPPRIVKHKNIFKVLHQFDELISIIEMSCVQYFLM